jgi:sortase A
MTPRLPTVPARARDTSAPDTPVPDAPASAVGDAPGPTSRFEEDLRVSSREKELGPRTRSRSRSRSSSGLRSRREWLWTGIGLVLAGLGLLGYLAWQFWGTNVVSDRHREQALAQLHAGWESSARDTPVNTAFGAATAIVEIPRFGHKYKVPVFEGTDGDVLAVGYGHFPGTKPGQQGNYALAAHRVTHGEPLRDMPDLQPGDLVNIVTRTHTYVYRLVSGGDDLVVPMTARWVTASVPHNPDGGVEPPQAPGGRLLTLTTCAELFHTDNRMIAFGVLERTVASGREGWAHAIVQRSRPVDDRPSAGHGSSSKR